MGIAVSSEFLAKSGPGRLSNPGSRKNEPWRCLVEDGKELTKIRLSNMDFASTEFCLNTVDKLSLGTERGAHNGEESKERYHGRGGRL